MLNRFLAQRKRNKLLNAAPPGALKDYLNSPLPSQYQSVFETHYLALDFETTGLDLIKDEILSFGYVHVSDLSIDLTTAAHRLVKPDQGIPEDSAIVHHILDDTATQGMKLKTVLDEFLDLLKGKVLLAHYAVAESSYLNKACEQVYGCGIVMPVADTLMIEQTRNKRDITSKKQLKLHQCCSRYNLPQYKLHDALNDAISCAELFLAQTAYWKNPHTVQIRQLINYLP